MTALRVMLATTGAAMLGWGCWLLVTETREGTVPQTTAWLAGAVVVHDGLVAPLLLLLGAALGHFGARLRRRHGYGPEAARQDDVRRVPGALRGGLIVAGCLTLVALPALLRQDQPRYPSALPLDYTANWLTLLGLTTLVTVALLVLPGVARRLRTRRTRAGRARD
ncbi:hypothetical protein LHJ74_16545 [Streptomyces sp. N2-109]|uniref:Lipoprotein n=1 Tax=Streptomyces gossypii TaxID=2883101 RepID=A0ABT2JUB8_9ACTN|nr:hypothetical protein [Streptomyces gossypii]MCT2591492.1 hypothetical protein [Streptomyces gossypii]